METKMILRGAAAAISLFALFNAHAVQAETISLANFSKMNSGDRDIALLSAGRQDGLHPNFATIQKTAARLRREIPFGEGSGSAAHLKHLIGWAEAGRNGYDAVQHGASIRPPKRPTEMSVDDIYQWIADTPGQSHAIGRYQFIPSTLNSLVHEVGLTRDTLFTSEVQDHLADVLLEDAGYSAIMSGQISRHRFMENLARIWAGFPTSTGRSYYDGYAGNRAVITWNEFDTHMKKIFSHPNG
ncbi:MAG: hypothetical protein ACOH2H_00645 [Cypionkella sp.]